MHSVKPGMTGSAGNLQDYYHNNNNNSNNKKNNNNMV